MVVANKEKNTKINHFYNAPLPHPWFIVKGIKIGAEFSNKVYCESFVFYYYDRENDNKKHYFCANMTVFIKNAKMPQHDYDVVLGDAPSIEELVLQFNREIHTVILIHNGKCLVNNKKQYMIEDFKISQSSYVIFTNISCNKKFANIEYRNVIPWKKRIPYPWIASDVVEASELSLERFMGLKSFLNFSHLINNIVETTDGIKLYIVKS